MTTNYEHQHQLKPGGIKDNIDNPDTPSILHWLPTVFLLGVVGLGALGALSRPQVRQWTAGKSIVTGEAMAEYEKKNLDPQVPWRQPSVNLWGGLAYRLFGEARDGAVIGTGGWLFTSEEFQTARGDQQEVQHKLTYIKQVRDELAKDSAKLVVALIPAKVRVYADKTGPHPPPAAWQPLYQSFRRALEQSGIPTPDLEQALRQARHSGHDVFLRTDTHWTPYGATVAAQAIVPVVRSLHLDLPTAQFAITQRSPVSRPGDLLRYIPVPAGQGPAPDAVQEPTYQRTDGGDGLLGDEPLAVTLVGTSYSAQTKENVWHFDQALGRVLGAEVLNAAKEGQGPVVPMREYLNSKDRKDNPPQVVIWEIPERFLRVPDKDRR